MDSKKMLLVLVFMIAVVAGCGSKDTMPSEPLDTATDSASPASDVLGMLPPADAFAIIPPRTSSALLLERNGVDYAPGLAQLITDAAPSAGFDPAWIDGTSGSEKLAYAIYSFNVDGYRGIEEVMLEWSAVPTDYSNLWVGLSHWDSNTWSWHTGPSDGVIELGDTGYIHYTKPGTGDMLIAIVMLGTEGALLDSLQVGEANPEDWSMFGHDPQHTRRSPYIGPQTNNIKWSFTTQGQVHSSPAIGSDGTVYIGSYDGDLYAINPDGSRKWAFGIGGLVGSSAAIGPDGTIYVGGSVPSKKLFAINPNGTEKWTFPTIGIVNSSPAIGADGTIYVGCGSNEFYAIHPDGSEKWSVPQAGIAESSPAIAADGTIYIGGMDLLALNPDGTEQWTFFTQGVIRSSPAIDADGTIYVGTPDRFFYAIHPDGSEKWVFETDFEIVSSAAIAENGTIYIGSFGNRFYALNPDSSVKWIYEPGGNIWSSPAIDAEGTIYVGVGFGGGEVHAINPDGSQKWVAATENMVNSSPAIGADGTLYVGSLDNRVYAFRL